MEDTTTTTSAEAEEVVEFPSFLKTTRIIDPLPSVSERYFRAKLVRNDFQNTAEDSSCEDFLVMAHSNKIVVITLAPTHDLLRLKKTVSRVDFESKERNHRVSRLENQVSGKHKRGAQKVQKHSVLCSVECTDGSAYKVRACVSGKIVEINRRLLTEPGLLTSKPWSDGFVAIIQPPFSSPEVAQLDDFN